MCKVLRVSKSGYYYWLGSGISKRAKENQILTEKIEKVFEESRHTYGSPRIHARLIQHGVKVSQRRVAKLMKLAGIKSKVKKKYKATTDSDHHYPISDNLLDRNFTPNAPNKAWVSDITYIRTSQGWLYLTTIMDLFDRQIIGWALSKTMKVMDTIVPAWLMATAKRPIASELIFHSDRGVQYASTKFRKVLEANKLIKQSMSRRANCWDNAVAEAFFKTLKTELVYHHRFDTRNQAEIAVFEYIETWYNRKRIHSSLGYLTPIQMELNFYQNKNSA